MKKYFSELQKVKLFQNLKHTLSKHYAVIILLAFLEFQNMETEKVMRGHLNGLCRCFSARLSLIENSVSLTWRWGFKGCHFLLSWYWVVHHQAWA